MSHAHGETLAPASTAGLDIVLTIEHTESSLPGGYPTMGAVRQTYAADGSYTYSGFGGPNHFTDRGTFVYARTGDATAKEDAMQTLGDRTLPYHMEYVFATPTSGRWKQDFAGGIVVFQGSFALSRADEREPWAPETLAGATVTLMECDRPQPCRLETVQHGDDTWMASVAGRQGRRSGTWRAKRLSARSLVEEATRADGALVVRSFTFTHRAGGVWKATDASDGSRHEGWFRLSRDVPR
ncbi:MAG TPA: hypothetical protein VFP37_05230 [Steroidobacteraceae bacterium]|nr:hypothetical protein [Steroidobacteraceae bacterium]